MDKLIAILVCVLALGIVGLIFYIVYLRKQTDNEKSAMLKASTDAYKEMSAEKKRHVDAINTEPNGIDESFTMAREALRRRVARMAKKTDKD